MKKAIRWILLIFLALFAVDMLWPDSDFFAEKKINPKAIEQFQLFAMGRFPEISTSESVWFQTTLTPAEQTELIELLERAKSKRETVTGRLFEALFLYFAYISYAHGEFLIEPVIEGVKPHTMMFDIFKEGNPNGAYFPYEKDREKMKALLSSIVQRVYANPDLLSKGDASWK